MTQAKIIRKLRKLGMKITVLTAQLSNRRGIPDTLFSFEETAYFMEIKIYPDKLSAMQVDFRVEFRKSTLVLYYAPGIGFTSHPFGMEKKVKEYIENIVVKLNAK